MRDQVYIYIITAAFFKASLRLTFIRALIFLLSDLIEFLDYYQLARERSISKPNKSRKNKTHNRFEKKYKRATLPHQQQIR